MRYYGRKNAYTILKLGKWKLFIALPSLEVGEFDGGNGFCSKDLAELT